MTISGVILVLALTFIDIFSQLILLVVALCWCGLARIPIKKFKGLLGFILGTSLFLIVMQGLFFWRGLTELHPVLVLPIRHPLSGQPLRFTREGLIFGVTLTFRVLCVVFSVPIVTMTTPASKLIVVMSKFKVPFIIIFAFATALRFTPLFWKTFYEIVEAQKLRAYDVDKMGFFKRIRAFVPLVQPLLISLLRRADQLEIAIEARAFGAPVKRTYVEEISLKGRDYVVMAIMLGYFAIGVIYVILYGGFMIIT